jgi:hypothetical protein
MGPFAAGWTEDDVEVVLQRNEPEELLYVPIVVGMNADYFEPGWAEKICLRLCEHPHFNVRGNAILGLGHTARTCRRLTLELSVPVIAEGLHDASEFVRDHAYTAASDLNTYLNVTVPGYEKPTWDED